MKMKMKIIIVLLLMPIVIFGQATEPLGWDYSEIFMITRGLPVGDSLRYSLNALATVYTKNENTLVYAISDTLSTAFYPPIMQLEAWNTSNDSSINKVGGYNFCGTTNTYFAYSMDTFGYGSYKFNIFNLPNRSYFYIDYRDNLYRYYFVEFGHPQDIWIKYDYSLDKFYYLNTGPNVQNLDEGDWTQILCGSYLKIWEIKNQSILTNPITEEFPSFWENCMGYDEAEGFTLLAWGKIPESTFTEASGYKLYRKFTWDSAEHIHELSSFTEGEYYYKDSAVVAGYPAEQTNTFSYYARAYKQGSISEATNIISTGQRKINFTKSLDLCADGNNPKLQWLPYRNTMNTVTGYKIYSVNKSTIPAENQYQLLASVSSGTFEYTDISRIIGGNSSVFYKVKAMNNNTVLASTEYAVLKASPYKINSKVHVPFRYALTQNYPNPFNPETTIEYTLEKKEQVNLKVYDLLGRELAVLVNEVQEAGSRRVRFAAGELPAGVYFYTLRAGDFVQTKKMCLLK